MNFGVRAGKKALFELFEIKSKQAWYFFPSAVATPTGISRRVKN